MCIDFFNGLCHLFSGIHSCQVEVLQTFQLKPHNSEIPTTKPGFDLDLEKIRSPFLKRYEKRMDFIESCYDLWCFYQSYGHSKESFLKIQEIIIEIIKWKIENEKHQCVSATARSDPLHSIKKIFLSAFKV